MSKGAKVDQQDQDSQTALFAAITAGHLDLVDLLIEKKCPIEAHTKRGETALMWSAMHQQLECSQLLIDKGAELHVQDENGQCALDHAESTLNSHVVEIFREACKVRPRVA